MGIDPGFKESAFVIWDGKSILKKEKINNNTMLNWDYYFTFNVDMIGIELIHPRGMPVSIQTIYTTVFVGRMVEIAQSRLYREIRFIDRKDVKLHICGQTKAKDSNIRQALIDKIGKPGIKKAPGPTYGIAKDLWQALAIAVFLYDTN